MNKGQEIAAWNRVFNNLGKLKVKLADRPNHPQLMAILGADGQLASGFEAASRDFEGHKQWHQKLASVSPAFIKADMERKAAARAKVKPPTNEAKILRRIFRKQTENEPCSLVGAQHALDSLSLTGADLARLEAGLKEGEAKVEEEWSILRWKITDLIDEVE